MLLSLKNKIQAMNNFETLSAYLATTPPYYDNMYSFTGARPPHHTTVI